MFGIVELQVSSDLPPGLMIQVAQQLVEDLERAGVIIRPAERSAGSGERGVLSDAGKIALEWIGGPAVRPIIETVKAFLVRDRSLRISVTRPDGAKMEVDAKNIDSEAVATFLGLARDTLG